MALIGATGFDDGRPSNRMDGGWMTGHKSMKLKSLAAAVPPLYFICSFFACISFAAWAAVAHVKAEGVSNFEGASGYAALIQIPLWFGLFVLLAWLAFIPLRRHRVLLGVATVIFAGFTWPCLVFLASFL